MIKSFADEDSYALFLGKRPKRLPTGPGFIRAATRKLLQLDASTQLIDLAVPPGNGLHALGRDRAGQHAIKVNDQYRICFTWRDGNAYDVEVTDYH